MKILINLSMLVFLFSGFQRANAAAMNCTNFSGFWQGMCYDSLVGADPSYLSIEQNDCAVVQQGTVPLIINGTNTDTWSYGPVVTERTMRAKWDSTAQKHLAIQIDLKKTGAPPAIEIHSLGTMKMLNYWKLQIQQTGQATINGGPTPVPYHLNCNYWRKI